MSFIRYIGVLEVLAMSETGATAGRITRMNTEWSQAQVEKTLKTLIGEGMVRVEKIQYRPHIQAKIFHLTEKAVEYCEYVTLKYDKRLKQLELVGQENLENDMPF